MQIKLKNGTLDIREYNHDDYTGVDIEFIPDKPLQEYQTNPRVLIDQNTSESTLNVRIWNNLESEDYTDDIDIDLTMFIKGE